MAAWFTGSKITQIISLAKNGDLYDVEHARKLIGTCIFSYLRSGTFDRLVPALELPENLVDESNPAISGFVSAYKIHCKTKKEN
jgi:hypothetical protein